MISSEKERELLASIDGDDGSRREALGELFQLTHRPLHRMALRVSGNAEAADDAVQETFAAVMRSIDRFRGESKLSTWMTRIAIRETLRAVKRGRPTEQLEESAPDPGRLPSRTAQDREGALRLLRAITELPAHLRVVVALAGLEELPRAEIAEILGVPTGTVHSRLHEARQRLRQRLGMDEAQWTRNGETDTPPCGSDSPDSQLPG